MRVYLERQQRWITLDHATASGGQGAFHFVLGEPKLGVKIMAPRLRNAGLAFRLGELCRRRVDDRRLCWPLDRVRLAPGGDVIGVLIERISGVTGLAIVDATVAARKGITVSFRTRLWIVRELVAAVKAGHGAGFTFEDINESNLMIAVGRTGCVALRPRIALIDIDGSVSFRFRDPLTAKLADSSCGVARPEFLPPEIHRLGRSVDLRTIPRTVQHDVFAVAVLVWQLLMGQHPYSARNVAGCGQPQDITTWIAQGLWPWAPVGTLPAGFIPNDLLVRDFNRFPVEIRGWFHRVFHDGTLDPTQRPSLDEFVNQLDTWRRREDLSPWSWFAAILHPVESIASRCTAWLPGLCRFESLAVRRAFAAMAFFAVVAWLAFATGKSGADQSVSNRMQKLPRANSVLYQSAPAAFLELLGESNHE